MAENSNTNNDPVYGPVNARVFEDNFNVLSQIINQYPATSYTEGVRNETDNSLSTSNSQEQEKQPLTHKFKIYLLIFFSTTFLIYGCQNSLLGPAMTDLTKILNTTSENISIAVSLKCLIFSVSTLLVSLLFKLGHRQFQYAGGVLMIGFITGLTPHMNSFKQYLIGYLVLGFSSAFVDSVTNLVVLELFSLNSKVYMQIAHGAYTVGTIFGPLIIGPFLSKKDNSTIPSNVTTTTPSPITTTLLPTTTTNLLNNLTTLNGTYSNLRDDSLSLPSSLDSFSSDLYLGNENEFTSRIVIPYTIVSVLLILSGVSMVILQILRPYVPEKRKLIAKNKSKKLVEALDEEGISQSTASSSSPEASQTVVNQSASKNSKPKVETVCQQINLPWCYYLTFLGLTGILLSVYTCVDGITGLFMPSFLAKGELKIEKDDAAFMSSIISMAMAIGRGLTIIFALKTTCKTLLFVNLSLILTGYVTLTFFAVHSRFITWIAMGLIGSGFSSTYPLILSYIENRIVITNKVQLYLLFTSVLLLIFAPTLIGHYIDTAPMMFAYACLGLAGFALVLMLSIHATDVWKKKLIRQIQEDQANLIDED